MPSAVTERAAGRLDLLDTPLLGAFLKKRYARPVLQLVLFALAVVMIAHGFLGPKLAPRNLATLVTWVHYRGILILVLVVAGNLFCMGCPFMLPRNAARRFLAPRFQWPHQLRNKWVAVALFAAILFSYELFDLWGSPTLTASLIVAYFAGALLVDGLFKNASFCKYVCPLGQFNFTTSTVSPIEIAVAEKDVCATCETHDCIRGTFDDKNRMIQRGCELSLFQPEKVGNMDCTFCLDCVHACPHDNVALTVRLPGSELWNDDRRSGIGRLSQRKDIAALVLLFTFGALMNAFGMVSPVYAVQHWLGGLFGTHRDGPILATLFGIVLLLEPALLLGFAALWTRRVAGSAEPLLSVATRFVYTLVPIGVGIWVAHYAFHLFTGLWTVIPVAQDALNAIGITFVGDPRWTMVGLPTDLVAPLQIGFLSLGLVGSVFVAYRIAQREHSDCALAASIPWAAVAVLLFGASIWLLAQPMEMRGSHMGM